MASTGCDFARREAETLTLSTPSNLKASATDGLARDHHNQMSPIARKERTSSPRTGPTRCRSSGHHGHNRLGFRNIQDKDLPDTWVGLSPTPKGRDATEKVRQRQKAFRPNGTVLQDARHKAGGLLHGPAMRRISLSLAPTTKMSIDTPLNYGVRPRASLPPRLPAGGASQNSSPAGIPGLGVARPAYPLPHESAMLRGARSWRRPRAQRPQVVKADRRHCLLQQAACLRRRHTGPDSGHQEITKASALHHFSMQTRPLGAR